MTIILMGIGYLLLVLLLLRFFQSARRWDEEISSMKIEEEVKVKQTPRPKAA
jgi:hypothetical protein